LSHLRPDPRGLERAFARGLERAFARRLERAFARRASEVERLADRLAGRGIEIDTPKRRKAGTDAVIEALTGRLRRGQSRGQDLLGLDLYRMAVLGGARAETLFHSRVQPSDHQAGHTSTVRVGGIEGKGTGAISFADVGRERVSPGSFLCLGYSHVNDGPVASRCAFAAGAGHALGECVCRDHDDFERVGDL
jgi:hypothetical protein